MTYTIIILCSARKHSDHVSQPFVLIPCHQLSTGATCQITFPAASRFSNNQTVGSDRQTLSTCACTKHFTFQSVQSMVKECVHGFANVKDLRAQVLPPTRNIANTLYSGTSQLRSTCRFFTMAMSRRATV
jgi:hypothetical protein